MNYFGSYKRLYPTVIFPSEICTDLPSAAENAYHDVCECFWPQLKPYWIRTAISKDFWHSVKIVAASVPLGHPDRMIYVGDLEGLGRRSKFPLTLQN